MGLGFEEIPSVVDDQGFVIASIEADGIQDEPAGVWKLAIAEGLAVDGIGRDGGKELGHELGQGCGIGAAALAATFEGNGGAGHVDAGGATDQRGNEASEREPWIELIFEEAIGAGGIGRTVGFIEPVPDGGGSGPGEMIREHLPVASRGAHPVLVEPALGGPPDEDFGAGLGSGGDGFIAPGALGLEIQKAGAGCGVHGAVVPEMKGSQEGGGDAGLGIDGGEELVEAGEFVG